jgi:hypothetical protein
MSKDQKVSLKRPTSLEKFHRRFKPQKSKNVEKRVFVDDFIPKDLRFRSTIWPTPFLGACLI